MYICLLKTDGENSEVVQLSGKPEYVLGREDSDVTISDERCSRRHAELSLDADGKLRIKDLQSRNGTIVNKRKVTEAPLAVQDTFRLGRTIFVVLTLLTERDIEAAVEIVRVPLESDGTVAVPPPLSPPVNPTGAPPPNQKLGSILLNEWPNNFRSLRQDALANFVDHLDEDQKKSSRRLLELARQPK